MGQELQLLEENKNLVLTGAPGTGKTFMAREMALKLIFSKADEGLLSAEEKSAFENQYCFVQFHPSYDYTDFVEGLRPFGEGQIGFKRQDGVFKAFCKRALAALKEDENLADILKRRFVFVIDEINRGEISKIFGELFFSIEPGYRGTKGMVWTQYTNLIPDDDDFTRGFYIPENVYIIGTMNDIDRSVESFDFAMRRRFVWHEITAKGSFVRMGLGKAEEYEEHPMGMLNEAISNIPGLNSSYHIGAAYFLKGDKETTDLWDLRLKPLLKEYLRGMPEAKKQLAELHKVFDHNYTSDTEE
jgi:5-methylcytosine-specific restriction endonuclease McrBC GTP-binding regulatory subunit McrB